MFRRSTTAPGHRGLLAALALTMSVGCGDLVGGNVGDSQCSELTADCNDDPADGCEADMTSADTCGSCDQLCGAPRQGTALCTDGTCEFECDDGLVPCAGECRTTCAATNLDTAGQHSFTVPADCTRVHVSAWGAGGGNGGGNLVGGGGGYAEAIVPVTAGEVLTLVVGGPGGAPSGDNGGVGGAPGGGRGGSGNDEPGGGGGGFSGAFRGVVNVGSALVIAGGGGGSSGGSAVMVRAGAGGGLNGENGAGGPGGTQTAGFAPLQGGDGEPANSEQNDGGGGGGAGWYGGFRGSSAGADGFGAGGGSGYVTAEATGVVLETGTGTTPGGAPLPARGSAGNQGVAGRVIAECVAQ